MTYYNVKDLRDQFSLGEEITDHILAPMLHTAFHTFRKNVENDPSIINATDIKTNSSDRDRQVVVNGKFVSFGCNLGFDYDYDDDDSSIYITNSVGFGGDETEASILRQRFAVFIVETSFEKLKEMAAEAMMEDRSHLHSSICKFYYSD